jgi:hypothetical protein
MGQILGLSQIVLLYNMSESKFYVTRSGGYTTGEVEARQPVVIEAIEIRDGSSLQVIAPEDTARDWPTVRAASFKETEGPARGLGYDEFADLVGQ